MPQSPQRPNILLVLTDQQRFDTIAELGNSIIKTPTLDRLVREGTTFTRAYTPSPVCVSARHALVTGRAPHQSGCTDNNDGGGEETSVMEYLRRAGYQTHGVSKMHFAPPRKMWGFEGRDFSEEGGGDDDFREFLDAQGYSHVEDPHGVRSEYYYLPQPSQLPAGLHNTTWTTERSLDFLNNRDTDRPFFLWTSYIKPHPPFEAPTPWNRLYRAAEMDAPLRFPGDDGFMTYWNRVQNRYKYRDKGSDEMLMRTLRAAYYACISFIDYQLKRIIENLEASGELDNTLILFTADHGEMLGDYGCVGKRSMLEASARVPLLARLPGRFEAGAKCDVPATLLDILPTCLGAANIEMEASKETVHGRDLATLNNEEDRVVLSQFSHGAFGLYMAAAREWKYIYSAPDEREWLFDLRRGCYEAHDLARNPMFGDKLRELRAQLLSRLRDDNYDEPLTPDGKNWKQFGRRELPDYADFGLLFQDAPGGQERIDALGPDYARPASATGRDSFEIMRTDG